MDSLTGPIFLAMFPEGTWSYILGPTSEGGGRGGLIACSIKWGPGQGVMGDKDAPCPCTEGSVC